MARPSPAGDRATAAVARAVRRHHLLAPGERVVVAVSGGADSVFLLLALHDLARRWSLPLHVAHLDHGWRGADGAADARWVEALARRLGLTFHAGAVDAPGYARRQALSPEDAARRLRYAFLRDVCRDAGTTVAATGHTEDDQLETIILACLRGSGPVGLGGMDWSAPLPAPGGIGLRLVRPLLALSREAVRRALRSIGQDWREDATNLDARQPRSRVRQEVLPLLEAVAPGARRAVLRSATLAAQAGAYLRRAGQEAANALFSRHGGAWRARRADFLALDLPVRSEALRWAVAQVQGSAESAEAPAPLPEWAHVQGALETIERGRGGAVAWLAPAVQVRLERGWVMVERPAPQERLAPGERPTDDPADPGRGAPVPLSEESRRRP